MIGQTISRYRILSKLGKGGMGEVFLAEDTGLGRKVALKFLPPSLEHDDEARRRFLREAKSAAAIDHPYSCKLYEVGEVDGKGFIAMEVHRGQDPWAAPAAGGARLATTSAPGRSPFSASADDGTSPRLDQRRPAVPRDRRGDSSRPLTHLVRAGLAPALETIQSPARDW